MMSGARPTLPPNLEFEQVLAAKPGSTVLLVLRGGARHVLRLDSDPARTARERSPIARVESAAIVTPTEWGNTPDGLVYTLRPYVAGRDFEAAVRDADEESILTWVRSALEGLGDLHRGGLVHRDVKASNLIVADDGSTRWIDLEFTGAPRSDERASGTRAHLAPEVLLGRPHRPSSDLFAFGAMLAYALGGPPAAPELRGFPGRSFWAASGCDPDRLPKQLVELTLALVRRLPSARPESAQDALRYLAGASVPTPPSPRLPLLFGRQESLEQALTWAVKHEGWGLIGVHEPSEVPAIEAELELRWTLLRTESPAAEPSPEASLQTCAPGSAASVAEGLAQMRAAIATSARGYVLALPAPCAREVEDLLARELVESDLQRLRRWEFPPVSPESLEHHLLEITQHASPKAARNLARSLTVHAQGRRQLLNLMLERACELAVLRPAGNGYALLRDSWPIAESVSDSSSQPLALAVKDACARGVLECAAALQGRVTPRELASIEELGDSELTQALSLLYREGWLEAGCDSDGQLLWLDPDGLATAWSQTSEQRRFELHRRCANYLSEVGAPKWRIACHLALSSRDPERLAQALDVAEEQFATGHPSHARELAGAVLSQLESSGSPTHERALVLTAKLETAQANPAAALAVLEGTYGSDLPAAPASVLLAAAEASELAGERATARGYYERALDAHPSHSERLRALLGRAYATYLDGHPDAALQALAGLPAESDPDETAGTMWNLRAAALIATGSYAQAHEALDEAALRAQRCGDPSLLGRTELNRALVWRRQRALRDAIEALQRAAAAFERADHVKLRSLALNNLGVVYRDMGHLALSRRNLACALELRQRTGDAHGTAVSTANLGFVELDAGHLASSISWLERARELLRRGGYQAELAVADLHYAIALGRAGAPEAARTFLRQVDLARAGKARPLLAARAQALSEPAFERSERVIDMLRTALATPGNDFAETLRTAQLLHSLRPGDDHAANLLSTAAAELGSPVREAEAQWLLRDRGAPPPLTRLRSWEHTFAGDGRTDLVHAINITLGHALHLEGMSEQRREALGCSASSSDALVDGLPAEQRTRALDIAARLVGADVIAPTSPGIDAAWLVEWNRNLAREEDLTELLRSTVDRALELCSAESGMLVLLSGGELEAEVARGADRRDLPEDHLRFSRTVVRTAIRERSPVVSSNVLRDPRFAHSESAKDLDLRSLLCVPLPSMHGLEGAIYLARQGRKTGFDVYDVNAVDVLGHLSAVAVQNLQRRAEIEALSELLQDQVNFRDHELTRMRSLLRQNGDTPPVGQLIGETPAIADLSARVIRFAASDLPVLICGPRGSELGLVARALHEHSARAGRPFLQQNLAALAPDQIEEELFGSSVKRSEPISQRTLGGLFTRCRSGTLHLDGIDHLPAATQLRLLDALERGDYPVPGSRKRRPFRLRLLVSPTVNLRQLVDQGAFSNELYHQLAALRIDIPPLHQRLSDIPLLVQDRLDMLNARHGTNKRVLPAVLARLAQRPWPGELRELHSEVARLFYSSEADLDDPDAAREPSVGQATADAMPASYLLEDVERVAVARALEATGNNKGRAAKLLGISRAGLYKKLERLGLN